MHNQIVEHLVNVLQQENLRGLLNSETMGTCLCVTTHDDLVDELKLRIFHSFLHGATIWIRAFVMHTTGTTTLSKSYTCGTP